MDTSLTKPTITARKFTEDTKALKRELKARENFIATLAGKRKGECVDYDRHTCVKVAKDPTVSAPCDRKLLYETMVNKPVKDVFKQAFPCVTTNQEQTEKLQKQLQELIDEAHTSARVKHDVPTKTVAVASARGAVVTLLGMLYHSIPEALTPLRPQDEGRAATLRTMRDALEADPSNLLEMAAFGALRARMQ